MESSNGKKYLTSKDILALPYSDIGIIRIDYGKHPYQFGHLRLPKDLLGPYPVLAIIHGGCWSAKYANLNIMSPFAEKFTKLGFATWNIEYRGIGHSGGGWPGTFHDVANALEYLRQLATQYPIDLNNIILVGHSAGGHLGLWAAAIHKLSSNSEIFIPISVTFSAVVNIAGPANLRSFMNFQYKACGDKIIEQLLGSDAALLNVRLGQSSPYDLLPLGVKQIIISGKDDQTIPVELITEYATRANIMGDVIKSTIIEDVSHFEVISPYTSAFNVIEQKICQLII